MPHNKRNSPKRYIHTYIHTTYIHMHCLMCCVIQMLCTLMSVLQADITNIDITRLHILCLRLNLPFSSCSVGLRKKFMLHARCNAHEDAPILRPCRLVEARTPLNNNWPFRCIDISIFYILCWYCTILYIRRPSTRTAFWLSVN
jgi:hypothetical protein